MTATSVSIVIPAYNEGAIIRDVVTGADFFLRGHLQDYEIIVVDDGSADDTLRVLAGVRNIPLKVIANGANRGKGYSVRRGIEAAVKEYVLFCDADLSTPLSELLKFLPYFDQGYDIVIGSRALPDSRLAKRQGILRRSMGKTFNFLLQRLLLKGIRDTQCGFKCFRRDQAKELFSRQKVERFCFDAEILYIARRWGLKIRETGVEWANRPDSRVAIVNDSLGMFIDLFRIKSNGWRGMYDRTTDKDSARLPARTPVRPDARAVPAPRSQKTLL
jgi:dolichyl-phosphate beta-glucosyltransferase